jgi:ubiquinone/menaquinone biosynthesis C-methylase UbiE
MNALVGFQFLSKNSDGRYALTPESAAFLVSSKPGYLGKFAEFSGLKMIHTWLPLPEIVRTGKPNSSINQQDTGAAFFQELVEPIFNMSYPATQVAGQALGLANVKSPIKVLDIGTGSGVWGIGLAQQSPQVSVTAQDLPSVLDVTRQMVKRFNLADRFSYLPGDFHTLDFGTGYNLVTFGHILHMESVDQNRQLLKRAAAALAPKGTVVISEFLVNQDRSGPPMGLIFAVNMLAHTDNGDTFSFEEISGWLKEAGLVNPRKIEPGGPVGLVMADKP